MHIKLNTGDLDKALGKVAIATQSKTLPILSSVLIEAGDGFVTISATDLELFVTEKTPATIKQAGAIIVAFRLLNAFVSRATAKETELKIQDKLLIVTHGENVANLETLDAKEFPPNLELIKATKHECDAAELVKPLQAVEHAISREESQFAMTGVNINSRNGGCDVVATDSRRLAVMKSGLKLQGIDVILPRIAVSAIIKGFEHGGEATISVTANVLAIKSETSEIRTRLIEATYPKYAQVIPEPNDKALSALCADIQNAITTASLFLKQKEIAVRLTGKKKEIEIGCYDRFTAKIMGAELSGQPDATKHVNFRFLLDVLNVLENDTIRIEVSDNAPIVIREGGFTEVINSLRIEA